MHGERRIETAPAEIVRNIRDSTDGFGFCLADNVHLVPDGELGREDADEALLPAGYGDGLRQLLGHSRYLGKRCTVGGCDVSRAVGRLNPPFASGSCSINRVFRVGAGDADPADRFRIVIFHAVAPAGLVALEGIHGGLVETGVCSRRHADNAICRFIDLPAVKQRDYPLDAVQYGDIRFEA
ncbi:hypothetical protein DCWBC2_0264 [Dehalococcoides mccartyi]|nr:hypothetical protein DCWBC2_0264 [Dehalococcoides mccartyi]